MPFSSPKTNPSVFSRRSFALFFLAVFVLSLAGIFTIEIRGAYAVMGENPLEGLTKEEINKLNTSKKAGVTEIKREPVIDPETGQIGEKIYYSDGSSVTKLPSGMEIYEDPSGKITTSLGNGWVYDALLRAFAWVCDFVLYLFSFLVALGGFLLDLALYITSRFGFTKSEIVQAGWTTVRDLANMFFSVVLLVIAFATILRVETYGMKQVLWRLVVAALLINFSLVIAGVIIDASNVLTKFFLSTSPTRGNNASLIGNTISNTLLKNMEMAKFWKPSEDAGESVTGAGKVGGPTFTKVIVNTVLGIVVMIITGFVLFAAGILFYIRMVVLWILLIFAPLAWLSMILPGTRSMVWDKWWHNFIKYVIFAPVYAFFLYLTMFISQKNIFTNNPAIESAVSNLDASWQSGVRGTIATFFFESLSIITNYVVIIIFLLAGLIFARSSGIAGANVVANMGKSYGRMWSRWAAKGGGIGGSWVAQKMGMKNWGYEKDAEGNLVAKAGGLARFQRGLSKTLYGAGRVKRTAFAMMSPQSWSRAWAMRKQRADAASFDKGAGRLDDLITGLGSIRRLGTKVAGSDTTSAEEKERIINEEAYHVYQARMRGDAEYRGIKTSPQEIKDYLASKNIPEGSPKAQAEMQEWDKQRATDLYAREFRQEKRRGLGYVFNETFGPGMREQMAESREVARRQQEYQQTIRDEDQLVHYFLNARDPVEKEALLRMVASINALNTTFGRLGIQLKEGMLQNYIQKNFSASRAPIIGADVSAMAAQNGNFSAVGLTKWDAQRNQIVFTNAAEQGAIAASKAMQMPTQSWAINSHPDSFITRDASGAYVGLSEYAKAMLKNITAAHTEQVGRFQGRTLAALYQFRDQMENYIKANISGVQQQIALDFVERIRTRYETA